MNQQFVDALINADYGNYDLAAASQKTRDCIVRGSYGIRDAISDSGPRLWMSKLPAMLSTPSLAPAYATS